MQFNLDEYQDWRGNIDDLVDTTTGALKRFGRGHQADMNVRLVRDYIARGILSPADERQGKEAVYGFQHLKELMAARVLRSDGWSLRKIAETFERDRNIVNLVLDPGYTHPQVEEANADEFEILSAPAAPSASPTDARGVWASLAASRNEDAALREKLEYQRQFEARRRLEQERLRSFEHHALTTSTTRSSLQRSLRALGSEEERPPTSHWTRFDLTEWCQVAIERKKLRRMTLEEAEAIGRAITAALSDPMIRKQMD